ncbi:MAG: hypothetical protein ACT4R6_13140 [Gemmatimonadaceae bacterium]
MSEAYGMLVRAWRFITIMLTALLATVGFTHFWQWPPRMEYDGPLWLRTLGLYVDYGPAAAGPLLEVAAVLATFGLVYLLRGRGASWAWALVAAVLLVVSMAAWWAFVYPVSNVVAGWPPAGPPENWTFFRAQWEYTHVARALLMLTALGALVYSVLVEVPVRTESADAAETSGDGEREAAPEDRPQQTVRFPRLARRPGGLG